MRSIEIFNKTEKKETEFFAETVLKQGLDFLFEKNKIKEKAKLIFSIVFLEKEEIRKLNKEYRDKDDFTDTLSFCYNKDSSNIEGEILLCLEVIRKNAQEDGRSFEDEFAEALFHSVLHIFGYTHSKKMFSLQKEFLKDFKITLNE
jgi:probable rRNA maturation factor